MIAGLEGVGCGLLGGKSGDDDRLVEKGCVGNAGDQIVGAEEKNGKDEIDVGPGDGNQGARCQRFLDMSSSVAPVGDLVAGVDIGDVLSGHADVAAGEGRR